MNRNSLYEADDDTEEDDIGEDIEDLRRAFMVSDANSDEITAKTDSIEADGGGGGEMPGDSENDGDFEMIRATKSQVASSTDANLSSDPPMGLSLPSDSESEDDFEMIRMIKSQLALPMDVCIPPICLSDDDDDGAFETLRAIRRRFSAYENFDPEGNFMNESPGKKKQITGNQLSQCQIQRKYKLVILLLYMKTLPCSSLSSETVAEIRVRVARRDKAGAGLKRDEKEKLNPLQKPPLISLTFINPLQHLYRY